MHTEEPGIIRVKLQSSFSRRNIHNLWIQFTPHMNSKEGITGWYCQCKNRARTLGFSSHISSVSTNINLAKCKIIILIYLFILIGILNIGHSISVSRSF